MRKATRSEAEAGLEEALAGEPLLAFDSDLRVLGWYHGAEEITGVPAAEALGRRCFELLGGVAADWTPLCRPDCRHARSVPENGHAAFLDMIVDTAAGPRRVELSTVALAGADPPAFLHLLRRTPPAPAQADASEAPVALTPRQREILGLLANGVRVKAIASHLGLTQTTVRNHIRGLLARLGCHSQLEAVAKARRLGTVERGSVAPRRGPAVSRRGPEAGRRRPSTT